MGKTKKATSETLKIRAHNDALRDITDIIIYIGITRQQPLNAFKVSIAIERAIEKIGQHPFAFRECEEIPTKTKIYRKAICLSWLIIFKITGNEIIILAVIHSARKPSRIKAAKKRN